MKKVLFISSTGGHLSEMMQLKKMFKDYDYHIITEKTNPDDFTKRLIRKIRSKTNFCRDRYNKTGNIRLKLQKATKKAQKEKTQRKKHKGKNTIEKGVPVPGTPR